MLKLMGSLALLALAMPAAGQQAAPAAEQIAALMRPNLPMPLEEGILWTHVRGEERDLVMTLNVVPAAVENMTNEEIGAAFGAGFCVGNGRDLIARGYRVRIETRTNGTGPVTQRATIDRCPGR
jgi:hypothetical protein